MIILQSTFNTFDLLPLNLLSDLASSDEMSARSLFFFYCNDFNISLVITHLTNMAMIEPTILKIMQQTIFEKKMASSMKPCLYGILTMQN